MADSLCDSLGLVIALVYIGLEMLNYERRVPIWTGNYLGPLQNGFTAVLCPLLTL